MSITVDNPDVVIFSDEVMLSKVKASIAGVLDSGQAYTLFGSRQVTKANLGELRELEEMYSNRVFDARGETGFHELDHRGGI